MNTDQFVARVRERAGLSDASEARRASEATLVVLGRRLAGGEPSDLAAELPAELAPLLTPEDGEAEVFDLDGFYQRIAEREGCSSDDAQRHAQAVLQTIKEAVPDGELEDVRAQLPNEFLPLLR